MSEAVNILTVDLPGHGQDASDKDKVWDFDFICNELNDTLANFTAVKFANVSFNSLQIKSKSHTLSLSDAS